MGMVFAALTLGALSGCGGGAGKATVSGEVTVDNEPIKEGRIVYLTDGQAGVEGKIKDGKYSVQNVPIGAAKVQIFYPVVIGVHKMLPDSPPVEQYKESLPDRFNLQTTLKTEVKSGDNPINWPLKTK
jgi:hypothetical protein